MLRRRRASAGEIRELIRLFMASLPGTEQLRAENVGTRRHFLRMTATGALLIAAPVSLAATEPHGARRVTLVVPFPKGGSSYFLAEVLARGMARELGQPVTRKVRAGDYGIDGLRELEGRGDGHTLYLGSIITNSMTPVFHEEQIPFDYDRVVEPLTKLALFPSIFMVNSSNRANSVEEFLSQLKKRSGTLVYGTDFLGTTSDIYAIELAKLAGLKVAYRATSGALGILADLMAKRIDATWLNAVTATQNRGKYKALAVMGPHRLPGFPGVPTLAQAGYPGVGAPFWQGLFITRGASPQVVTMLYAAARRALESAQARAALRQVNAIAEVSASPQAFAAEIARERAVWGTMKNEVLSVPRV
jgi:tripartite-type tricarboxylate transporter receptor subunit TctC